MKQNYIFLTAFNTNSKAECRSTELCSYIVETLRGTQTFFGMQWSLSIVPETYTLA